MTDNATSVFLEFKPVGNFHWIVNKASTFSFDQMTAGSINNHFKFIPCSACNDNWRSNIDANYCLKGSAITKCHYTDDGEEKEVDPPSVELIATEVGYGGVIVTLNNSSATIELTSSPQNLKAIFLVNASNNCVLAYCILPEPVKVANYLQLSYNDPIIEITSTVNTQYD